MVGGGGLAMEEGTAGSQKMRLIGRNFNTVLTYRDIDWPHGGHLGVCYDRAAARKNGAPLDDLYLSTFLLAGGAHPYYSPMEHQLGQYPRLALRYAEIFYDNQLRPLKTPEAVIALPGSPALDGMATPGARAQPGG